MYKDKGNMGKTPCRKKKYYRNSDVFCTAKRPDGNDFDVWYRYFDIAEGVCRCRNHSERNPAECDYRCFQEYKAEKAIETLKKLSEPKAYVIREGYLREIPSEELVIGDVVELEAGRYIPADMRLLSASNLKVEEVP